MRNLAFFFLLMLSMVLSGLTQGQHMLFHLLGAGQPIANFTSASQTVAESTGVWAGWSSNLSAWTRRRQILVVNSPVTVSNFPVLVQLDSSKIDYAQTQNSGQDLRFADDSGAVLSHQIERWDEAGISYVWVNVPTISAAPSRTSFWMYYGNTIASDGQNSTGLWGADHKGVWHLNGGFSDSTANGSNGTNSGTTSTSGYILEGAQFVGGSSQYVDMGGNSALNITGALTIEAWIKISSQGNDAKVVSRQSGAGGGYKLGIFTDNKIELEIRDSSNTYYLNRTAPGGTALSTNTWYYVVGTYDQASGVIKTYVNGALDRSSTGAGILSTSATNLYLGREGLAPSYFFSGVMDEVRVSNVVRSPEWIQLNYLTMMDQLLSIRGEETPTSGAAVITVQLNTPAQSTITIPYSVSGTATAGTDHSRVSGNLTINGGSSSGSLNTYVLRDNLVEGSETAILTLGAPTGASLGPDTVHTVTITDEPLSPPDAIDDAVTLTTLNAVTIPVLSNDTDANGDTLTITAISSPTAGTAVRFGQTIRYTPTQDFPATDSFTYTISDGRGGTDTATVTLSYQIPFTWIGSGADANWTTTANWLGGVVPGAANTVYFNNQCTTYCSPQVNSNASVANWKMNSSFAGTINQGAATITLAGSWLQNAGGFVGSSSDVVVASDIQINGGTFTSTSGVLYFGTSATEGASRTMFKIGAGSTFNHNSGTIVDRASRMMYAWVDLTIDAPVDTVFNNFTFEDGNCGAWWYPSGGSYGGIRHVLLNRVRVDGVLTHNCSEIIGDVALFGDLVVGPKAQANNSTNTGAIEFKGTGVQSYTLSSAGGRTHAIVVNKTGGSLSAGSANFSAMSFSLNQGTFTAPTGSFSIGTNVPSTGIQNLFTIAPGQTFSHNNGTVEFYSGLGNCSWSSTVNINVDATLDLNNVKINGTQDPCYGGFSYMALAGGDTINVLGNLELSGGRLEGVWSVAGNISATSSNFGGGGATVTLYSGGSRTIAQAASSSFPGAVLTMNKTTSVTQTTAVSLSTAGQDLTLTNGTYDMAGFALAVSDVLTVGTNAKLLCNGGALTYSSAVINGEVSCGPSAGITWTGLAGDGLWSTAGNWTNNTIPSATDIAYFNGTCTNCNATINSAVSVKGVVMASTYTGTITQGAGNTVTVGTSGWSQAAGTFAGGNSAIAMNGPFSLSGGTFTSTSATMTTQSSYVLSGSPTFNHNSGTVAFSGGAGASVSLTTGAGPYWNATFTGHGVTFNLTGSTQVNGLLTLTDTSTSVPAINTGTIEAAGDLSFTGYGKSGTALIRVIGSSNQTVTGVSGANIPNFEIASTGGTVSFVGTLTFMKNYTYTSGSVAAGTSTLNFSGANTATMAIVPGGVNYNHVTFTGNGTTFNVTGTMSVGGNLLLNDLSSGGGYLNTGTFNVSGNFSTSNYGKLGSATIRIVGSTNQTLTGAASAYIPNLEIASTGGVVSLVGTLVTKRDYTYTSGVVDAGTSTLSLSSYDATTVATVPGPVTYYNVTFGGNAVTFNLTGTLTVAGTLTLNDGSSGSGYINGGTILASGNIGLSNYGKIGTVLIRMVGSTNQTLTGIGSGFLPELEIASTGGTVTLAGVIQLRKNYTYTSGAIAAGTSTMVFWPLDTLTTTIIPGAISYNAVTFQGAATTIEVIGTVTANGLMLFNDTSSGGGNVNTGTLVANGNINYDNYGKRGSATITAGGATSTTITVGGAAIKLPAAMVINKSGGASLTMLTSINFSTAGQDVTLNGGVLDLGGYDLTVNDILTVSASTTLRCNGGTFTSGTLSNSGTINCPGYGGYEFNWTGAAADSNWNTAANWAGGVVPSASSVVVFNDSYCGANCNATMPASASIRGIKMESPYSGTITQATGFTFSVGNRGWTQAAGTFIGSNAALSISTLFSVTGGSFTSTSGTLSLSGATTTIGAGVTFNHNGGSIVSTQYMGWGTLTQNYGGKTLNNLSFVGDGDVTFGSTVVVDGNLSLNVAGYSAAINGQVDLKGNMTVLNHEDPQRFKVRFVGANVQTVTTSGSVGAYSSKVGRPIIDKTGGSVTFINNAVIYGIEHIAGTTTFASGYTTQIEHFIVTDCWAVDTITPGSAQFADVKISGCGPRSITGTLTASGNVELNINGNAAGLRNGKVQVGGNFTLTQDENYSSTTEIEMTGSTNTSMTAAASNVNPGNLTINKTGGSKVTLLSNYIVRNSAADVRIVSGTLDVAGKVLTIGNASGVDSVLTLESGTTLNLGGGSATYEALVNNGGTIVP